MPLDDLPGAFQTPKRADIVARYKRDILIRIPDADVREGTQFDIDARTFADSILPIYADAIAIGNDADLDNKTSKGLEAEARALGIPERLPAAGASGFVQITASTGGGTILAGTPIRNTKTRIRYQCTNDDLYLDGYPVPIEGIDVGPGTNVDVGVVLRWESAPSGIGQDATVLEQSDGSGLSGGREVETDAELKERIREARATPAASGNDAAYRKFALETPGIAIQELFTIPAVAGPGTTGFCFTMRTAEPGTSRIPSAVQVAKVLAHIQGELPADDGIFACALVSSSRDVTLTVRWAPGATGWTDAAPWPPVASVAPNLTNGVVVTSTILPTASTAVLARATGTGANPVVGTTIALWDTTKRIFRKKRIASVIVSTPGAEWQVTFDLANGASDPIIPIVGQPVCPWSDSLQSLVPQVLAEFDKFGPGEQFVFFDAGLRRKRLPLSPARWPNTFTGRFKTAIYALPSVDDVELFEPTIPFATPLGTPAVSAKILELRHLMIFPLT